MATIIYNILEHSYHAGLKMPANLHIYREGRMMILRLHATDIVKAHMDGRVRLYNGGFETVTTKKFINQYMPQGWQVTQVKGVWKVLGPDGMKHDFKDGMTIDPYAATPDACVSYDVSVTVEADDGNFQTSLRDAIEAIAQVVIDNQV